MIECDINEYMRSYIGITQIHTQSDGLSQTPGPTRVLERFCVYSAIICILLFQFVCICMGNVPYMCVCLLLHLYTHTTADLMVSGLNLPKLVFGWNSNVFLLLIESMPAIFFE